MVDPQMVMYEEEFNQIQQVCDKLVRDANALVVFIVDKNGQLIATSGEYEHLDTTSLASLTAGNIAATGGMAKLLKENEFATQFHEGERQNIHIQIVGQRVILVVIFDDLARDVEGVYRRVLEFLEVDADFVPSFEIFNPARPLRFDPIRWTLKDRPRLHAAVQAILPLSWRRALGGAVISAMPEKTRTPKPAREVRERLAAQFRPQVEALSRLLERDLTHWCEVR